MAEKRTSTRYVWIGVALIGLVLGVVAFAIVALPKRLVRSEWRQVLAAESSELNECAECHDAVDYHTCGACHDDHGAIEFADLPFYALILLVGDVPEPGFVRLHDILPYQDQPGTRLRLIDFLENHGVASFESVTLISADGGFVTIESQQISDQAWLLPYEDGVRFACEDLHVSSWLKGITKLIVVGEDKPLEIDGNPTSMGRLLLGPTVMQTVEQAEVSLRSEVDGVIRAADVASRLEGVALASLFDFDNLSTLRVRTKDEGIVTLDASQAQNGFLTQFRGRTTLVLPERGRSEWITDPVSIEAVE